MNYQFAWLAVFVLAYVLSEVYLAKHPHSTKAIRWLTRGAFILVGGLYLYTR